MYKYNPEEAEKSLEEYFGHVEDKEKKQRIPRRTLCAKRQASSTASRT